MDIPPAGSGFDSGFGDGHFNLGAYHQQQYREAFRAALAAGEVKPLVFPWSLIGSFFLPLLYLSIPHKQRPWLYRMRWPVAAAVVCLNIRLIQTTSADNEAVAYATGLMAVWGIIWHLRLLIFTRPQWDAARVERRPRGSHKTNGSNRVNGFTKEEENEKEKETPSAMVPPDESVAASLAANYEYFWQPFPATAPFLTRLGWVADLIISFRGSGWNFTIPSIPHPPPPKHITTTNKLTDDDEGEDVVRLDLIPLTTRAGTYRSPTYTSFLRSRLTQFLLSYLTVDILTATMRHDPYFVLGPSYASHPSQPPLPRLYTHHLPLPEYTIPLMRSIPAMVGIIAVMHLYFSLIQLAAVFLLPPLLGTGAELWQHPTLFGSLGWDVADRDLAGFWGERWHQTFRAGFVAPADYLLSFFFSTGRHGRHGRHHRHHHQSHDGRRKAIKTLVQVSLAFLLSGLLHAAGSYTSLARESALAWPSALFFCLQGVGVLLQSGTRYLLRPWTGRLPRWARRAGNLAFVVFWLQMTGWGLVDDMSRGGVWLFEPIPVSPLRALGFGPPGEGWWRWEGEQYGWRWYQGRHWWESGLRL